MPANNAAHKIAPIHATTMKWLPADALVVDPAFQRNLNRSHAQRIADEFDPDALGKPLVAAVGDTWYIIDGQHRVEAVRLAFGSGQLIECEVVAGLTREQAAALFVARNKVKQMSPLDRFIANLAAGESEHVEIAGVLDEFGVAVQRGGACRCASSLLGVYRGPSGDLRQPIVLRRTIGTLVNAWGKTRDSLNGDIVAGMGLFVQRYDAVLDYESLGRILKQRKGGPLELLAQARQLKALNGGSVPRNVARVVLAAYNTAKRTRKLPEWDAPEASA